LREKRNCIRALAHTVLRSTHTDTFSHPFFFVFNALRSPPPRPHTLSHTNTFAPAARAAGRKKNQGKKLGGKNAREKRVPVCVWRQTKKQKRNLKITCTKKQNRVLSIKFSAFADEDADRK
jgi:hypothetical protein